MICENCNIDKFIGDDNLFVCPSCGEVSEDRFVDDVKFVNDTVVSSSTNSHSYKRSLHFLDVLRRLQNQEKTLVSQDVIQKLKNMFPSCPSKREIRKNIPRCYYRNIPQIMNLCWDVELPYFHQSLVCKMLDLFIKSLSACQNMSIKHFLHANYLIHQFLILLHQEQYLKFIPKMKNATTLQKYNSIWKMICEKNNWKNIPYNLEN